MILSRISKYTSKCALLHKLLVFVYRHTIGKVVDRHRSNKMSNSFEALIVYISGMSSSPSYEIWPAFGTLLGLHRDNGPISHDLDIDFAAYHSNRDIILSNLKVNGAKVLKSYYHEGLGNAALQDVIEVPGVGEFDLFYFFDDEVVPYYHDFITGNSSIYIKNEIRGLTIRKIYLPLAGLKKIQWKGFSVYVPMNIEEHLAARYGEDFMIPNARWSYKSDRKNIITIGNDGYMRKFS